MIQSLPEAVVAETQRRLREAILAESPDTKNVEYALALKGVAELRFRNRVFHVPPIPYPAGVRLVAIRRRLEANAKEDDASAATTRALLRILEDAADLAFELIRPVTLLDRLTWRFRANPFLDSSEEEIGQLIGLFWACRTSATVRFSRQAPQARHKASISPTRSRYSRKTFPRGSAPTGTR
jgi:hypothetical protein